MEVISLLITCIKHESSNTNDDTVHFTTQRNKSETSQVATQTNISQPSNMESSIKKEENVGHVTSSPSPGDGLVTLKHTAQEQKNDNEKCQIHCILPGMSDEKANKSENTIKAAENGECSKRSHDLYNQIEAKKNTDAFPETVAEEKDVKEAFTIIKWEAPTHDTAEKCFGDNLNRQASGMNNTNSLISSPLLSDGIVTIKHKEGGGEKKVEKYLGQMDNSQPGMLEEMEIKSEHSISDSNNGESSERSNDFFNQAESREDNYVNSESTIEKNVKEGFTIIKLEGCRFDKTENDNLIQPNTRKVDTNSVNEDIDNDSHIIIVKHSSLKEKDSQVKNKSVKRPSTSCKLPGKQPVVILKRLKMKDGSFCPPPITEIASYDAEELKKINVRRMYIYLHVYDSCKIMRK